VIDETPIDRACTECGAQLMAQTMVAGEGKLKRRESCTRCGWSSSWVPFNVAESPVVDRRDIQV
jgi:hypothetical protein